MMKYEIFKDVVENAVLDYLPPEFQNSELYLQRVKKVNGMDYDGLVVRKEDTNVCPVINLTQLYEDYKLSEDIELVTKNAADTVLLAYDEAPENEYQDVLDEGFRQNIIYEISNPWIVQNTSNNGATVLLNTEVFKELSDHVEGNLIIIPSSTHEVLAMDARMVPDCDDLSAFIQQTNMDVVSPSERLSNQVYMYDRKENSIEMVTRNKLDIIPQESRNISYEKNIKPEI